MIIEVNEKGKQLSEFLRIKREQGYEIFEKGVFGKRVFFKRISDSPSFKIDSMRYNDYLAVKVHALVKTINNYSVNRERCSL